MRNLNWRYNILIHDLALIRCIFHFVSYHKLLFNKWRLSLERFDFVWRWLALIWDSIINFCLIIRLKFWFLKIFFVFLLIFFLFNHQLLLVINRSIRILAEIAINRVGIAIIMDLNSILNFDFIIDKILLMREQINLSNLYIAHVIFGIFVATWTHSALYPWSLRHWIIISKRLIFLVFLKVFFKI